ncbi:RidA family protein [Leucobacter sp.]
MSEARNAGTDFFYDPGSDREAMARLGLGGIAVAAGRGFFGSMAINLSTLQRLEEADTIASETRICLEEVLHRLAVIGGAKRDIVRVIAYADEKAHLPEMWEAYDEFFADLPEKPKRTTLVAGIAVDCRLEFEVMVAHREEVAA